MSDDSVVATRRQLHGIAESFIAGPQYRAAGTIRLAVRPDGVAGVAVPIAVRGTTLVWSDGSAPLAGSVGDLAAVSGIDVGPPPAELYHSVAPLGADTVLDLDADAADLLYRALHAGELALTNVLPQGNPVLWPEHLDIAVSADEVNYGVSAGDDGHPMPYAYVGPWDFSTNPRTGALWNAPFGALHPLDLTAEADALAADIADFFRAAQADR